MQLHSDPEALHTLFLHQQGLETVFRAHCSAAGAGGIGDMHMLLDGWDSFLRAHSIFNEPWVEKEALQECFDAGAVGSTMTFAAFNLGIVRLAIALFSNDAFDEDYPLLRDKVRLLLFRMDDGDELLFDGIDELLAQRTR